MIKNTYILEDEFGDIVQKARQGLGLDVDALALQVGLSAQLITAIEHYECIPTTAIREKFANVLQLNAPSLHRIASSIWHPPTISDKYGEWYVHRLQGDVSEANCYIVRHSRIQSAIIIDPGVTYSRILDIFHEHKIDKVGVLITHNHADHTRSLPALKQHYDCETASEFEFETLATPGHTPDSVCYRFPGFIFVGDLLFAGSVGRAPTRYWKSHLSSVANILSMNADITLYPGHGPVTTIDTERKNNPFI